MGAVEHRTPAERDAGLELIRSAPADNGTLELIVSRPAVDQRVVLDVGALSLDEGLVGDTWRQQGSRHTPDGSAEVARQLTVMNARAIALLAGDRSRWPEAGDQLYVDLDLSVDNLPPGTRLQLGEAVVEISEAPHTGCAKFSARFGVDALRFVNSPEGRRLNLRGINARVVEPGTIRVGDVATKALASAEASSMSGM
jgi:MOSC domain-containing protein YiiM